jgi:hypothetical protein
LELPISRVFIRKLKEEPDARKRAIWREAKSIPERFFGTGKAASVSFKALDKDVYMHVFSLPKAQASDGDAWFISFRHVKVWNQVRIADYGPLL